MGKIKSTFEPRNVQYGLVDIDRFVCSMIERYCKIHNIDRTLQRCWLDKVLEDQGIVYKDGELQRMEEIKGKVGNSDIPQRMVSAKAKEEGYSKPEIDINEMVEKFRDANYQTLGPMNYSKDIIEMIVFAYKKGILDTLEQIKRGMAMEKGE